jgi:hypothetical protein
MWFSIHTGTAYMRSALGPPSAVELKHHLERVPWRPGRIRPLRRCAQVQPPAEPAAAADAVQSELIGHVINLMISKGVERRNMDAAAGSRICVNRGS